MSRGTAHAGACFVAGTPVHAKHGLVPIEQLRAGNLVLTRRRTDDAPSYTRIETPIRHRDARVLLVTLFPDGEADQRALVCTDTTWLLQDGAHGFIRVDDPEMFQGPVLATLVGEFAIAWGARRVLKTETPGLGWTYFDDQDYFGPTIDLRDGQVVVSDIRADSQPDDALEDDLTTIAYEIELPEGQFCFVGEQGLCVAGGL